eukprot:g1816.t1
MSDTGTQKQVRFDVEDTKTLEKGDAPAASKSTAPPPPPKLIEQDLSTLDVNKLTPLSPEVISRQATINIGTIGHVAHGKSTLVKAISGVKTIRFKNEMERNITIKLGYANAKIYECTSKESPVFGRYTSRSSNHADTFTDEKGLEWKLVRHVSFVDCPGHDILMATMLNGAAVMDAALLIVAGNEECPQPQTREHLAAVGIMKLRNIIICQNKIDLVSMDHAVVQHAQIKDFVRSTVAETAPIIPVSAQLGYNVPLVCEHIVRKIPIPVRDFTSNPRMIVIRSFDVNKPGEDVENLKGGVAGGSILEGVLKIGDEIEVRPGIVGKDISTGKMKNTPIFAKVVSLFAEKNDLKFAVPGGLIGIGTKIDPTLTRADRLVGQVLGLKGHLPGVFTKIEINFFLLKRLLGVAKGSKVSKLSKGEMLMVNIGSTSTAGKVRSVKKDLAKIELSQPVCSRENEKIALSRRLEKKWRLIGWGKITRGK